MKGQSMLLFVFWLLLSHAASGADNPKYAISAIPAELLPDAKAVVRKYDIVFDITAYNKAVLKVTYAITILNKNGIDNSVFHEGYDKFLSVRKIDATIYDRNGMQVRTGLNTRVTDVAALSNYSLYNDFRIKVYDPGYTTTPFTVEYSYEIAFDGLFSYPDWHLYSDYNVAVENSTFSVIAPHGFAFRYLEQNINNPCRKSVKSSKDIYSWEISGWPAVKKEVYSPDPEEFTPSVFLAPDDFEIGGIKGNCESWSNLGAWIGKLADKKDILGATTIETVKSIAGGAADEHDKVRLLYEYLQNKVRYVSITEGLGGWQPIDAETVDRVSYGDCKALANYMKSILAAAGIKSYYTIIRAGAGAPFLREDFPSNQFNHAILCVPQQRDTIWLECTDQQIPFGYLGTFTDDRKALVITGSGGVLVRTPVSDYNTNRQVRNITVRMNRDGSAISTIETSYYGLKCDAMIPVLRMDDEDKKRSIHDRILIPGCRVESFSYAEERSAIPSVTETLKLSFPVFGSAMDGKLILRPDLMTRVTDLPLRSALRKSPVMIRRSLCEYDTATYIMTRLIKPDILPKTFSLKSSFGEYNSGYYTNGNKLICTRSLRLYKGRYPVEAYDAFAEFFEKVNNEDLRQIIIPGF